MARRRWNDESMDLRVGRDQRQPSWFAFTLLELPYAHPGEWIWDRIVTPPIPPYVEDDEEGSDLQSCPQCRRLIQVCEPGLSYCTNCFGVLCVTDALEILQGTPHPFHCPGCFGELEEGDYETWVDGYLCCHLCGGLFTRNIEQPDGVQLVAPGEEEFWPF